MTEIPTRSPVRTAALVMIIASTQLYCAACAQSTVGNATLTPASSSANEAYGVTSPFSTHQRQGNSTGIGGSTIGTESVTSESRTPPGRNVRGPAALEPAPVRLQLPSTAATQSSTLNPALSQSAFGFNASGLNSLSRQNDLSLPTFRSEPFTGSFGSSRMPALEPLRY